MEIFLPSKVTNALDTPKENDLEAKGTKRSYLGWREAGEKMSKVW